LSSGLILAGSADFKTELSQSDMFDPRLQAKVIKLVDVSYGGENGFNQAIELSAESLSNVKFIQEKKLIGRYFDQISQDTGKYCFGDLDVQRYTLKNSSTGELKILHLSQEQEKDVTHFQVTTYDCLTSWQSKCFHWIINPPKCAFNLKQTRREEHWTVNVTTEINFKMFS